MPSTLRYGVFSKILTYLHAPGVHELQFLSCCEEHMCCKCETMKTHSIKNFWS